MVGLGNHHLRFLSTSVRVKIIWKGEVKILYKGSLEKSLEKYTCMVAQTWLMLKLSTILTAVQETTGAYFSK